MAKCRYSRNDQIFMNVKMILQNILFGCSDGFDLMPKSATKIDPRPSDHVSDLESIIRNPDNMSVRSLKLPRSVNSRSKNQRSYQCRKESFREENVSSGKINKML